MVSSWSYNITANKQLAAITLDSAHQNHQQSSMIGTLLGQHAAAWVQIIAWQARMSAYASSTQTPHT